MVSFFVRYYSRNTAESSEESLQTRIRSLMWSQGWDQGISEINQAVTGGSKSEQDGPNLVRFPIEEDQEVEAHVTQWQELDDQTQVTQKQSFLSRSQKRRIASCRSRIRMLELKITIIAMD
jgi:hypothetical protein